MEYELENAFSDIEEDENDAPLNVVPFLEEQNLREWVPVKVSEAEVSIAIDDVEKELFQVLIKETEIICTRVFDEIRKKHLDVTEIKHVTMKHFISLLFEDASKLIFEKVNQDIQSPNIISRNTISAFIAAEAIISSYRTSPSEFFDDIERRTN